MATATVNLTPVQTTDAQFRAWGSGVSAQFIAMGLVAAADTGQINWTTVTTPAGANASQGYEILKFNDSLQATDPIFIKVEYGSGSAAATPAIFFTFGTGSNGTGTLTGPISARYQLVGGSYATNSLTCYISGSSNRIQMALFLQGTGASASINFFFSIERTKDASGADTNLGLLIVFKTSSSQINQTFWNRTTGTPASGSESSWGAMSNSSATAKSGTQVAVFPLFLNNAGIFANPPLGVLCYVNADIVAFGALTFTIYGASHTYMPLGSSMSMSGMLARTTGSGTPMMRWE